MSWGLASLLLVATALACGLAWYERSHPSPRVLALVGTLAALAVLGRVAFAPLPNVKPTTDIVLISGFALGGAPGFAVGALAALASNLFFGQGPWTPWQMAAWGLVGIAGAGLARLTGRRIGRLGLALAGALCGLMFGAIMDTSQWLLYSGDHRPSALLAYSATSLPWNLAHAGGNAAFALAFGPALLRAVTRFRERFEVRWLPPAVPPAAGIALLLSAAVLAGTGILAPGTASAAGSRAWLERAQNRDGGFGSGPGVRSSQLYSGWTALGLAAAGRNPADVRRAGGRSLLGYVRAGARGLSDTGEIERTILVLRAAGRSPRAFAGRDLVATLRRRIRGDGSVGGLVNLTSFAVLALRAGGEPARSRDVARAAGWIARQQNRDGGFSFAVRGAQSGIDDTGAALQALGAAGRGRSDRARRAARFVRARQRPDGGFPLQPGGPSNAQSTAWAVQGLLAAGVDPARVRPRGGGRSPLAYLRSLTAPGGAVRYSRTSAQTPVWVTAQALLALAGRTLPLGPVPRARRAALPARVGGPGRAPASSRRRSPRARASAARPPGHAPPPARAGGRSQAGILALARDAGLVVGLAALALDGPGGTANR